ncbi:MAG: heme ABC transporter ATP-binding protein [Microbacterium sp.]
MSGSEDALVVDSLCVEAGGRLLLDGVTFRARAGEVVALVGPNGAGKSTLLRVLAGDIEPDSGEATVGGRRPSRWKARELARKRAVMSQDHAIAFSFTVREVVEMGRVPHDRRDDDAAIIERALRDGDVLALQERDATTLSGGELSRTVFGRVLAQETPVVLLDEPTAALDLRHQEQVMRVSRGLADAGCCVVVVLHDLNLAARYADRVAMFGEGALVADGSPRDVLTAERIREVYRQEVRILAHPTTGAPLVVSV